MRNIPVSPGRSKPRCPSPCPHPWVRVAPAGWGPRCSPDTQPAAEGTQGRAVLAPCNGSVQKAAGEAQRAAVADLIVLLNSTSATQSLGGEAEQTETH